MKERKWGGKGEGEQEGKRREKKRKTRYLVSNRRYLERDLKELLKDLILQNQCG